ncbi:nicotinate-nucleotide adenylyltransferase [Rheinheimera muenzenbergensis]|uniref:Probable nicotinate-nucleotide adenylyltransferase n=1 Tax=Rheinheimera muenzenbergensis TaxID=1193628 RepID=A0ABU8C4H1_9GAMM
MTKHIGIFGGTFDPVHPGHIRCASFVRQYCQLDSVRLMPCHLPAHRASPGVSAQHRAAMVQLAIAGHNGLALEALELEKTSPSYTVDSLTLLRQREPEVQWYFIIGMDSLGYFKSWKDWQQILQLAHILVCQRPGYSEQSGDAPELLRQFGQPDLASLRQSDSGGILLLPNPLTGISATAIRQQLQQHTLAADSLDPAVLNYIQTHRLYQAL